MSEKLEEMERLKEDEEPDVESRPPPAKKHRQTEKKLVALFNSYCLPKCQNTFNQLLFRCGLHLPSNKFLQLMPHVLNGT